LTLPVNDYTKAMPITDSILDARGQFAPGAHAALLRDIAKQLRKADLEAEIEAAHDVLDKRGIRQATLDNGTLAPLTLPQRLALLP
jgi:hypothetical protein